MSDTKCEPERVEVDPSVVGDKYEDTNERIAEGDIAFKVTCDDTDYYFRRRAQAMAWAILHQ